VRGEGEQILAFLRVSSTRVGHLHVSSIPFIHIHLLVPMKEPPVPVQYFKKVYRPSGPVTDPVLPIFRNPWFRLE
jgi:hypothetical protein